MKANHAPTTFPFNGQDIDVERGSFITGRMKGSQECGISEQQWLTAIKYLKSTNRITNKTTNKFTVVTILNYADYQQTNQQDKQQINNKQTTNKQQITTNKNEKNEKNEKKRESKPHAYLLDIPYEDKRYFVNRYDLTISQLLSKAEDLYNYCLSTGKSYKDYKAFFSNALKKDFGERKIKVREVIKEYGQME